MQHIYIYIYSRAYICKTITVQGRYGHWFADTRVRWLYCLPNALTFPGAESISCGAVKLPALGLVWGVFLRTTSSNESQLTRQSSGLQLASDTRDTNSMAAFTCKVYAVFTYGAESATYPIAVFFPITDSTVAATWREPKTNNLNQR